MKAQEFLGANSIGIVTSTDARKERIDDHAAWDLVSKASTVHVAKGKKIDVLTPTTDGREACLTKVMGPSGNLRAPTLKIGDTLIVGFNPELYETELS